MTDNDFRDLPPELKEKEMSRAFRALAAEIMRLARGSGDETKLVTALLRAAPYVELVRTAPMLASRALMDLRSWKGTEGVHESLIEEQSAVETICNGALQIVASRLAGDPGVESRGQSELAGGIVGYRRAYDARTNKVSAKRTGK